MVYKADISTKASTVEKVNRSQEQLSGLKLSLDVLQQTSMTDG